MGPWAREPFNPHRRGLVGAPMRRPRLLVRVLVRVLALLLACLVRVRVRVGHVAV